MNYNIYFDESNKLDSRKVFSYYGGFGGSTDDISRLSNLIRTYCKGSAKELHFKEYTDDGSIYKYFKVINSVLKADVTFNFFIVHNDSALQLARQYGITDTEMRNMLYVKIPERLFYGITRYNKEISKVNIKVDKDDNYRKIRLYSKIKEQMNAHSAYRNLNYQVNSVKSMKSEKNISIQIIDIIMGITVFLMEKIYKNETNVTKAKSDLIYRLFLEEENILRFKEKIKIFKWDGNNDSVVEVNISNYIPDFLIYKSNFDLQELLRIQPIVHANAEISIKELQNLVEYPSALRRLLIGYKDLIEGRGRNYYLR